MICTRDFSITIESNVELLAWWTLNSADPFTNTDSVNGQLIDLIQFGAPCTASAEPGKISNCLRWTGNGLGTGITYQNNSTVPYTGNGFTFCFWWYYQQLNDFVFSYTWNINTGAGFEWNNGIAAIVGMAGFPVAAPGVNAWHFCLFTMTASGDLYVSIDGAALTLLGNVGVVPAEPGQPNQIAFNMFPGTMGLGYYQIDEMGLFSGNVNQAQVDYLWNGGAGRTFPISLP